MQIVEPIRDTQKITEIKKILKDTNYRDYVLFVVGINTGLRISDILKLKVIDVKDKQCITIREQKTNKHKRIPINNNIKQDIDELIQHKQDDDYLFDSHRKSKLHINRQQAYKIINDAARKAGITDNIGTHTLRKTFGYHHYQQFKDAITLQGIFNHSSLLVTLRYIGITQDIKDATIMDLII
jgi:integrase